MKKIILIMIVIFSFLSCTTDDFETITEETNANINQSQIEQETTEIDPTKIIPPTGG